MVIVSLTELAEEKCEEFEISPKFSSTNLSINVRFTMADISNRRQQQLIFTLELNGRH